MSGRLWAYLVTHGDHAPPDGLTGIADAPLHVLVEGDLAIWVSRIDAPPARDVDAIGLHNRIIVNATTDRLTPVPLRFGQVSDEAGFRAALADRAEHWHQCLADFAGAAEFGLQVRRDGRARAQFVRAGQDGPGRTFLESLRTRRREAGALVTEIRTGVGGLVRRERVESVAEGAIVARLAHLVGTGDTAAYRNAIDRLAAEHPECRFLSSGPWPPYSFAA